MSRNAEHKLSPWVSETIVQHMKTTNLKALGTETWFEYHRQLIQLNQQSIFEITCMQEETIKEWFVNYQKIPILIHESIQIWIWKQKVLPLLIELNGEPTNTFMLYSVFYHESTAVSLLENLLFHYDCIESLDDSALDLIDYVVENIMPMVFGEESLDMSDACEIIQRKYEIAFNIGIMSISIIGYFAAAAEKIPISILRRLLTTHDIPYLFIQLIEKRPWKKQNANGEEMIYVSSWEKMKPDERDKIGKVEGQVWIGLRGLLLNPESAPYYQITDFRLSQLNKLQKYMNEKLLDQISPLMDLRRWLSYLNVSPLPTEHRPLLGIEIIPKIKSSIMEQFHRKWEKLAALHTDSLYNKDIHHVQKMAKVLAVAYDFDKVDVKSTEVCAQCHDETVKRCSRCKKVWYCGRECQVKHWPSHRTQCNGVEVEKFQDSVDEI